VSAALDFVPIDRVTEATGVSERRLRALVKEHGIRVMRAGRVILFDEPSLIELKEALRPPEAAPTRAVRTVRRRPASFLDAALRATSAEPRPVRPKRRARRIV
jgi:hypothetical protein